MARVRAKVYSIKEIVKKKRIWVGKFEQVPYEFWKRRWDFLGRQLKELSDMQRNFNGFKRVEEDDDVEG